MMNKSKDKLPIKLKKSRDRHFYKCNNLEKKLLKELKKCEGNRKEREEKETNNWLR